MKKNLVSSLFTNPRYQPGLLVLIEGLVNAGLWVFVLTTFPRDLPAAVLHYSVGVGIDFVGEGKEIIMLPFMATAVLVLNAILSWWLRRISREAMWLLLTTAGVVQLLIVAAYVYIMMLNR